jgi:tRNA A-37 threonylcarbamoyl transferase component Bud32
MATDTSTIRWHLQMAASSRLLTPAGLPLDEWLRDGSATVVKDGPHRAVYRVRLPGLDCHVKHYRLLGWRSRVRQMIRPNKARREASIASELQARGIPTPIPIGWGVEGNGFGPAASWLITETVAGAVPLTEFLESLPRDDARLRQRLAWAVGEFVARLHAAGVVHHDLHPGNLLIRMAPDGAPLLWLIDLHAVRLGPPCPWPIRRENLVIFNRFFQMRAGRTDRLRFWTAYASTAKDVVNPARLMAIDLEAETVQSNLQLWRARDARCRHSNRYYKRVRTGSVRGYAVREFDPSALLAAPDAPFEQPARRILKDSRSSTVVEIDVRVCGVVRRAIYKRFRVTDRREPWLNACRRSAALRSWVFGHGLRERCLPTARPLAVFHRTGGGLRHEGYLLTEKIENAVDLHDFVWRLQALPPNARTAELRPRAVALAGLLRKLHDRGLSHRDLKAANLLTATEPGDHRFWFIDLVGVRRHRQVNRRLRVRDLMRLNVSMSAQPFISRTERLRFLLAYLQAGLRGRGGWKDLWREIAAATAEKTEKNFRNGRPPG